jgi:exopolysaccharide biosynthesis protein
VRSLIYEPYAGESLEQAVQAFPMLIVNGQAAFSDTQGDRISRRSVIGQDAQGRILVIVTVSLIGMRLSDLSAYLVSTDLGLTSALNLDGGGSTMLAALVRGATPYQIPSFDPVPAVLAVYPR